MEKIEIQNSFVGNFLYSFLWTAGRFQEFLARIFEWIFITPAISLAKAIGEKRPNSQKENPGQTTMVVLDCLKPSHSLLKSYILKAFFVLPRLNGIVAREGMHGRLLKWNEQIPILGFEERNIAVAFTLLYGEAEQRPGRYCDLLSLTTHERCGVFRILSKEIVKGRDDSQEVSIRCVWMSGNRVGQIFDVRRYPDFRSEVSKFQPSSIYYPPQWLEATV